MATKNVELTGERVIPTGNNTSLVPLLNATLGNVLKGNGGVSSCIDANHNLLCKVYKITIHNTGSSNSKLTDTINLVASVEHNIYHNLKW